LSSTWPANHHRTSLAGQKGRSTTRSSFRAAQDRPAVGDARHLPALLAPTLGEDGALDCAQPTSSLARIRMNGPERQACLRADLQLPAAAVAWRSAVGGSDALAPVCAPRHDVRVLTRSHGRGVTASPLGGRWPG
jgi:hypothetical protein